MTEKATHHVDTIGTKTFRGDLDVRFASAYSAEDLRRVEKLMDSLTLEQKRGYLGHLQKIIGNYSRPREE